MTTTLNTVRTNTVASPVASSAGSGNNLYRASAQWAHRPADERFWTLEEARDVCRHYADNAQELTVDFGRSALVAGEDDNIRLALDDGREATITNWAFSQLARTAGAPADYLRKLPPALAIQCIETGLDTHFADASDMERSALVHQNGTCVLRSLTSDKYSRFWNHKIFDRLANLQESGWKVPPARPSPASGPGARPATATDVLQNRTAGGGLAVNVGDMIAPAGIYASDHDMFAFMVNETARIDDGSDGGLSRGFFVSNSEVGAAGLRVTIFHYRHVCGNHIVWGASDVMDVSLRHIGNIEGKFSLELAGAVEAWANQGTADEVSRISRAKSTILGKTDDEVLDSIFKAFTARRKYNLPSGMSVKMIGAALQTAKEWEHQDGNPYSVWGVVNGITRLSQSPVYAPFADERNFLDRAGAAVFQLAS
jgi:hypothetical protein